MVTLQTYECPVHGLVDLVCHNVIPDVVRCMVRLGSSGPEEFIHCDEWAVWRPSAPAVHTQETRVRALTGHARDTNPW